MGCVGIAGNGSRHEIAIGAPVVSPIPMRGIFPRLTPNVPTPRSLNTGRFSSRLAISAASNSRPRIDVMPSVRDLPDGLDRLDRKHREEADA